jgi:hypothetical protein
MNKLFGTLKYRQIPTEIGLAFGFEDTLKRIKR